MTEKKNGLRHGPISQYTREFGEAICDHIIDGKTLSQIADMPDMPARRTVFHWLDRHAEFAKLYDRARQIQADRLDDLIMQTADDTTKENFQANRVKLEAYKWRASKLKPSVYSERHNLDHAGSLTFVTNPKDEELC
jgi:hypothetical protein